MKVLGFAVIAMGIIVAYIGVTGSQHRVMGIILRTNPKPSDQSINPSGNANQAPISSGVGVQTV